MFRSLIVVGAIISGASLVGEAASTLSYDLAGNQSSQQASVPSLPIILAQPTNQLAIPGGQASFSVVADTPATSTYQWMLKGLPIAGATSDSYFIPSVAAAHEGAYSVRVTNSFGSVTSASATLYLDSNENGLPDSWEQAAFGNLSQSAMGDFDLDGVSNLDEYLEGTNPASAASLYPRLTTSGTGGVIEVFPSKVKYSLGDTVSVRALPHPSNGFYGWSSALTGTVNPSPLTLDSSKTLNGIFSPHGVFAWGRNANGELMVPHELSQIVAVSAGSTHSLALRKNGTVTGWGVGGQGQITIPAGLGNVVQVAAGSGFSMALKSDGTVAVWGDSSNGKTTVPANLGPIAAVDAGTSHCLVLRKDGKVIGWGSNSDGQLDIPPGLDTIVAIAAGDRRSMALKSDGTVVAWGRSGSNLTTVPAGLGNVIAISAGVNQHFALRSDGTVVAWGAYGNNVPATLSGVVSVAAGQAHGVALKSDGSIVTWGDNTYSQRALVPGINRTAVIAAGDLHSVCIENLDPSTALPVLVNPYFALGAMGHPFYLRIVAKNTPISYSASGLPRGLSIDPVSGIITGSPSESGDFTVLLQATNARGVGQSQLQLTVNRATPALTSSPVAGGFAGGNFTYQATVSNSATAFTASGLPAGLTIDSRTGLISGRPLQQGTFLVILTASNQYGSESLNLSLEIRTVESWGLNVDGQTAVPPNLAGVIGLAGGDFHSLALKRDGSVVGWGYNGNNQTTVPSGLASVVSIAAGSRHSLALKGDGTVSAWGSNSNQQSTVPSGLTNVAAIAARYLHSLALKADGTIVGWGSNNYGQLTPPAGLTTAVAIATGERHTIALKSDGTVVGWGNNASGQTAIPSGLTGVVGIAAGDYHNLALRADGTVVAWGYNGNGEATVPAGLSGVVEVAAGGNFSMARKSDGSVVAWGSNSSGQRSLPAGVDRASSIAAGNEHGLVLSTSEPGITVPILISPTFAIGVRNHSFHYRINARNSPSSFGATGLPSGLTINTSSGIISGSPGQSGTFTVVLSATNGSGTAQRNLTLTVNSATPVVTSPGSAIASVGGTFSYQIIATNGAASFGASGLPLGLTVNPSTGLISGSPLELGIFNVSVSATNSYGTESAILTLDIKTVFGWGLNDDSQLVPPSNLIGVTAVASGYFHSLALKSDGTVRGWGYNGNNQTNIPAGLVNVVAIAAGERHSLALKSDGAVVGWGYNNVGQSAVPTGLTGVVQIAACYRHSLALKSDGTIIGWGSNSYGQLTPPAGLTTSISISTGERHSVALKSDGTVVAWGNNAYNQCTIPAGLNDVTAVACGSFHNLALRADGTVVAWGNNGSGQISVPAGLSGVVAISGGDRHSVALRADGSIVVWGANSTLPAGYPLASCIAAGGDSSLAVARIEPGSPAPLFIGSPHLLGSVGDFFRHQIRTRNVATFYAETGLPPGLVIDAQSGMISGRPTASGTYQALITARNATRTSQRTLTITINRSIPLVASPGEARAFAANPFSFAVTASNGATSYNATGLPAGLNIDPATGIISGNSQQLGEAQVTVFASNSYGTGNALLIIRTVPVAGWGYNGDDQTSVPASLGSVRGLAGGFSHSLAIQADGTVVGWGNNANNRATSPSGLTSVVAVAAGIDHSVALKSDGTVAAWGYNASGQTSVPAGLTNVVAIATKGDHTLALSASGTVVAWGANSYGQTTIPAGLSAVTAIAGGYRHSLAVKSDGTVVGWGYNGYGQTSVPSTLSNVTAVAAGESHSLALRTDGTVIGWGRNNYGQATPPQGLSGVVWIGAGRNYSLAFKADGTITAWGYGEDGQTAIPANLSSISFVAAGHNHGLAAAKVGPGFGLLAQWRETYFSTAANTGLAADLADPDGDGVPNLIEFITGASPTFAETSQNRPRLTGITQGHSMTFDYTVDSRFLPAAEIAVEWSDTLLPDSWSTSGVTSAVLSQSGSIQKIRATVHAGTSGKRFVRLTSFTK